MIKNLLIVLILAAIVALPFALRKPESDIAASESAATLVIVTPHTQAMRYEFALAFTKWHEKKYGQPVKIEWRNIGGTSEIQRYLASEYTGAVRSWWRTQGKEWPQGASESLTDPRFNRDAAASDLRELYDAFRKVDDSKQITSGIDLFFGGGEYDHSIAARSGLTVSPTLPAELFKTPDGIELIPERISGETWRTPTLFGSCVSTFGIVYNIDRLKQLGIEQPPVTWDALADFRFYKQLGVTDPTKSGSIAKAFEMLVHQKMHDAVKAKGYDNATIAKFEKAIGDYSKQQGKAYIRGSLPEGVPADYQAALEEGWLDGMRLLQAIGANARYFTDSASKVPVDVSVGDAAVGMAIDFYGRFQASSSTPPGGTPKMVYVTPIGGSSVSCDPISLLRGSRQREIATHFIEFVLSEDGQRLWTYEPGTPGGPVKYALRRLPIRRDFYPSTQPSVQAKHAEHEKYAADNLADAAVDPYQLAQQFTYYRRWTGDHFGIMRDMVRIMCLDSSEELRKAWVAVHDDPSKLAQFRTMPTATLKQKKGGEREMSFDWKTAPDWQPNFERLEYMGKWTAAFRKHYTNVAEGR